VFDSLDTGRDGYLTLEAFSSGFSTSAWWLCCHHTHITHTHTHTHTAKMSDYDLLLTTMSSVGSLPLSGQFLHGRRFSLADDLSPAPAPAPGLRVKETLYQSQWEAKLAGAGDEEEEQHFCMLLESLGASNVFEE